MTQSSTDETVSLEQGSQPLFLVAYDGSAMSEMQLHLACRSANDIGAMVRVLYVVELSNLIPLTAPLAPDEQVRVDGILDRAERIAEKYGVAYRVEADRARSVGEAIIAACQEWQPQSIFMGLRDRNRRGTTLMLSATVRYVLQRASCLVQLGYLPSGVPEEAVLDKAMIHDRS